MQRSDGLSLVVFRQQNKDVGGNLAVFAFGMVRFLET